MWRLIVGSLIFMLLSVGIYFSILIIQKFTACQAVVDNTQDDKNYLSDWY